MTDQMQAGTVAISGHEGAELEAYLARPLGDRPRGGVVVIHHLPGYDEGTKQITRTFAARGYAAVCPNLYSREGKGVAPDDQAAAARAKGGVPDEQLVGDVAGAAAHLNGLEGANGRIGVIGYCSGGRQSFLAAVSLDLDAAVDCYGAFVVKEPPADSPLNHAAFGSTKPTESDPALNSAAFLALPQVAERSAMEGECGSAASPVPTMSTELGAPVPQAVDASATPLDSRTACDLGARCWAGTGADRVRVFVVSVPAPPVFPWPSPWVSARPDPPQCSA